MRDTHFPDDIRQYDNDPRSPFYNDGGKEVFIETRSAELLSDVTELDMVENSDIGEIVMDSWGNGKAGDKASMLSALDKYFEKLAETQTESEWCDK